jgi:hypothetical protein
MRKRNIRQLAVSVGVVAGLLGFAAPADATNIGEDGCTPGYWKTHTEDWLEEPGVPSATVNTLFANRFSDGTSGWLVGRTFGQTLQGGGGPGVQGAEKVLARAATAAYLNASHEDVGYPWRRAAVGVDGRPALVPTVVAALESGDRAKMLDLAAWLDADNNLGCPL